MGLLDDAIREHLELKRNNGADPAEVARVEQEALEQPTPEELELDHVIPDGGIDDGTGAAAAPPQDTRGGPIELVGQEPVIDLSSAGQETAELDMSAVLAEDAAAEAAADQGQIPGQDRLSFE